MNLARIAIFILALVGQQHVWSNPTELHTRFGQVLVKQSQDDSSSPSELLYVSDIVVLVTDEALHLYNVMPLGESDVVLFGSNCRGSGCPNDDLSLLLLRKDVPPTVITSPNFHSLDETVVAKVQGDTIIINLGFEKRQKKIAVFDGHRLTIKLTNPHRLESLSHANCLWIYESARDQCWSITAPYDEGCNELMELFQNATGAVGRGISSLSNNPGFNPNEFRLACITACKTRKPPSFQKFQRSVCGGKRLS